MGERDNTPSALRPFAALTLKTNGDKHARHWRSLSPPASLRGTRLLATVLGVLADRRFKASPRRPRATSMRGALAHPAVRRRPPDCRHPGRS